MFGWILYSEIDPLIRSCKYGRRLGVETLPLLIDSSRELDFRNDSSRELEFRNDSSRELEFRNGDPKNSPIGNEHRTAQWVEGGGRFALIRGVWKAFGWDFVGLGCLQCANSILSFLTTLLLRELVGWLGKEEGKGEIQHHCFNVAIGVGICCTVKAVVNSRFAMLKGFVGAELHSSIVKSIYRTCLAAQKGVLGENTHTILTVDVGRIVNLFLSANDLWIIPLEIGAALYLLYTEVEFAFFAGLMVILFIMPINRWIAMRIGSGSKTVMEAKDKRVHSIEEILKGIRQIKMMGWESHFASRVTAARNSELKGIGRLKYLDAFCVYFWASTSVLFSVATFSLHVFLGHALQAETVFAANALFDILIGPLNSFPLIINGIMEGMVSLRRLEGLITTVQKSNQNSPETISKPQNSSQQIKKHSVLNTQIIFAQGASFHFPQIPSGKNPSVEKMALRDLSFEILRGTLTVICGEVGSGKTTLLNAMCRELDQVGGNFDTEAIRRISLVSQKPSLFSGTIRENILFGGEFDAERYWEVIAACGLNSDLAVFRGGDFWHVGPQGSKLSGGQRARVALARALYAKFSDIYLLDDILSSVDAHVSDWLIEKALTGAILSKKTRVVVTKSQKCIEAADQIIHMRSGKIESIERKGKKEARSGGIQKLDSKLVDEEPDNRGFFQEGIGKGDGGAEVEAEEMPSGHVEFWVYLRYFRAIGWRRILLVIISMCMMQATRNGGDVWLAKWIDGTQTPNSQRYLWMFILITGSNSAFTLVRAFSFAAAGMSGARRMHASLISRVMHARMTFFDSTSLGCMLNWFSSDTARIDDRLPFIANIFLANAFAFTGACVVLAIGRPFVLVLVAAVVIPWGNSFSGILGWQSKFRKAARELRRLEASTMSPLHTLFSETLDAISTIRAFQAQDYFEAKLKSHLDHNTRTKIAGQMLSRWIDIRLQLSSAALVTGAALIAAAEGGGKSGASIAGLGLTYALPLVGLLSGLLTTACETEQEMVAVERISKSSQAESDSDSERTGIPPNLFHTAPSIEFHNVTLRYGANFPAALSNFTLEILPGQKVALCGRTGAGKSTVVNALLRLADIESGEILVDRKDVKDVGSTELRRLFAVIPQVPFLFDGTLRENIDPLSIYPNSEIIATLRDLGLFDILRPPPSKAAIETTPRPNDVLENKPEHSILHSADNPKSDILEMRIVAGGGALSHGERQMICLARAVLQKPKCVILDEFACGIHKRTEAVMREIVARHFGDATVIEIAHDLQGIVEYDKVVVLAKGTVVEEGDPRKLVDLEGSVFGSMVARSDRKREMRT